MHYCPICNQVLPGVPDDHRCPKCGNVIDHLAPEEDPRAPGHAIAGNYHLDGLTIVTPAGPIAEMVNHGRSHFTPAQIIATGQLLAAAPALLAVCQRLLAEFSQRPPSHHPHSQQQYDRLSNAIAQATGGRQ